MTIFSQIHETNIDKVGTNEFVMEQKACTKCNLVNFCNYGLPLMIQLNRKE